MLSNTITINVGPVAYTLNRVSESANDGSFYLYKSATERLEMRFRHTSGKKEGRPLERHNLYVEHTVYETPTAAMQFASFSMTISDRQGTDPAAVSALCDSLMAIPSLAADLVARQQ